MKARYVHQCQICAYQWINGVELPSKCANPECRSSLWDGRARRRPGPKKKINGVLVLSFSKYSEFEAMRSLRNIVEEQAPDFFMKLLFTADKELMLAEIGEYNLSQVREFMADNISSDIPAEEIESAYRALNMMTVLMGE